MKFIIIYITYKNQKEAEKICNYLLRQKLIACCNYFPVKSAYQWKGKIENSKEIVSIVKTKKENWKKVKDVVTKMHSYDVPCIIKIEAEANNSFANWVNKDTK